MWYKLDELEEKYGLNKLSVYKLITQEPELRQYFKSMEGVLQINEQGIGILLKHTSKEPEDKAPATYADNNTIIIKKEHLDAMEENKVEEPKTEKKYHEDDDIDLFADAFNTKGSFFDDVDDKEELSSLEPEENFFSNIEMEYRAIDEDVTDYEDMSDTEPENELSSDFTAGLIFPDEKKVDDLTESDEVNAAIYDDTENDDFFSDEQTDNSGFLDSETPVVKVITAASEDDYTMDGYIKALKEKLIIQNEQVRAISNYLDVSKRLLIQDEKIVNIIEGMNKK